MSSPGRKVIIVLGPTAVGKTSYAIDLAQKYSSPVISCDSRQIYREMTIGTAVPSREELALVKHYFIHSNSVFDNYTAGKYELEAVSLCERLFDEGHDTLVMCGGSGFYIDAFCNGLDAFPDADPVLRAALVGRLESEGVDSLVAQLSDLDPETCLEIDLSNGQRVVRALEVCLMTGRKFSSFKTAPVKKRSFEIEKTGLRRPMDLLYERINARVDMMMEGGLLEEARSLMPLRTATDPSGTEIETTALRTVGYQEFFDYFDWLSTGEGQVRSVEKAVELVKRNSRHYARKQMSYWRRDASIRWIDL